MRCLQSYFEVDTWQGLSEENIENNIRNLIEQNRIQDLMDKLETIENASEREPYEAFAFKYSAADGNVDCMELLSSKVAYPVKPEALGWAAASNQTDSLEFLLGLSVIQTKDKQMALNSAIYAGHIESTQVLLDSRLTDDQLQHGLKFAVSEGKDNFVPLFLERVGAVSQPEAFCKAVQKKNTDLMDLLLSTDGVVSDDVYTRGLELAAEEGIIDSLGFLVERSESRGGISDEVYADLLKSAANGGQIPALEFLFGLEGKDVDDSEYSSVIRSAVWGGDNATIEHLLTRKAVSDEAYSGILEEGAFSQNQHSLEYLFNRGRAISDEAYTNVLKVAVNSSAPIQALKFLFGLGRVIDDVSYSEVFLSAARSGQLESLKFLLTQRAVSDEVKKQAWSKAITSSDFGKGIRCVEFLDGHEFAPQDHLLTALLRQDQSVLKRLLACDVDIDAQHESGSTLHDLVDAGSIATPMPVTFRPDIQNLFRKVKAINNDASLSEDAKKIVKVKVFTGYWHDDATFDAAKTEAIAKADELLTNLDKFDVATREFIIKNYIFASEYLGEGFDTWKTHNVFDQGVFEQRGGKGLAVDLAVSCGDTIDGLEDLFGKSADAIMQFMHTVPRANGDIGKVLPCSVVGQALRVLAKDPADSIPGKQQTWKNVMEFLTLDDIDFSVADVAQAAEEVDPLSLLGLGVEESKGDDFSA